MNSSNCVTVDLERIISLFYQPIDSDDRLGKFSRLRDADLPSEARRLLAHDNHMTVTLEESIGGPVDLTVLETRIDDSDYARKIVLTSQADKTPVMFGIVRVNLGKLEPTIRSSIKDAMIPLGRILIESDLLRRVSLVNVYQIVPGSELTQAFSPHAAHADFPNSKPEPKDFFGRTAIIFLDDQPVVELLEIVAI